MGHIVDCKRRPTARMHRFRRSPILALIVVAAVVVLIIVPMLLGMGIQEGVIAPPQLDVQLGGLNLVAATMQASDCDGYVTPCSLELASSPDQEFYVIWLLTDRGQLDSPDAWWANRRLITLRLERHIPQPRP